MMASAFSCPSQSRRFLQPVLFETQAITPELAASLAPGAGLHPDRDSAQAFIHTAEAVHYNVPGIGPGAASALEIPAEQLQKAIRVLKYGTVGEGLPMLTDAILTVYETIRPLSMNSDLGAEIIREGRRLQWQAMIALCPLIYLPIKTPAALAAFRMLALQINEPPVRVYHERGETSKRIRRERRDILRRVHAHLDDTQPVESSLALMLLGNTGDPGIYSVLRDAAIQASQPLTAIVALIALTRLHQMLPPGDETKTISNFLIKMGSQARSKESSAWDETRQALSEDDALQSLAHTQLTNWVAEQTNAAEIALQMLLALNLDFDAMPLMSHSAKVIRRAALRIVLEHPRPGVMQAVATNRDPAIREAGLAVLLPQASEDELRDLALNPDHFADVRIAALEQWDWVDQPDKLQVLYQLGMDKEPTVRVAASQMWRARATPEELRSVTLDTQAPPATRLGSVNTLFIRKIQIADDDIQKMVRDSQYDLRMAALRYWLGANNAVDAVPWLDDKGIPIDVRAVVAQEILGQRQGLGTTVLALRTLQEAGVMRLLPLKWIDRVSDSVLPRYLYHHDDEIRQRAYGELKQRRNTSGADLWNHTHLPLSPIPILHSWLEELHEPSHISFLSWLESDLLKTPYSPPLENLTPEPATIQEHDIALDPSLPWIHEGRTRWRADTDGPGGYAYKIKRPHESLEYFQIEAAFLNAMYPEMDATLFAEPLGPEASIAAKKQPPQTVYMRYRVNDPAWWSYPSNWLIPEGLDASDWVNELSDGITGWISRIGTLNLMGRGYVSLIAPFHDVDRAYNLASTPLGTLVKASSSLEFANVRAHGYLADLNIQHMVRLNTWSKLAGVIRDQTFQMALLLTDVLHRNKVARFHHPDKLESLLTHIAQTTFQLYLGDSSLDGFVLPLKMRTVAVEAIHAFDFKQGAEGREADLGFSHSLFSAPALAAFAESVALHVVTRAMENPQPWHHLRLDTQTPQEALTLRAA